MSIPSSRTIHNFLDEQTRLFNDKSRKDDFMALYRQIAPGGYSLEWPANGDVFHGWDHLERMWEDGVNVQSRLVSAMVANGEAATYFTHKLVQDGKTIDLESIETYLFREDGSLHSRFWPQTPDL